MKYLIISLFAILTFYSCSYPGVDISDIRVYVSYEQGKLTGEVSGENTSSISECGFIVNSKVYKCSGLDNFSLEIESPYNTRAYVVAEGLTIYSDNL